MQQQLHLPPYLHALILSLLFGLLALLAPADSLRAAGVIYVVPGGAGAQTGADWANAKDLQAALQNATSGDQIWVKAGTYKPTNGTDRSATFQLKSGVALYGGFAGAESSPDQRDPDTYISTLTGDLLGNDAGAVASDNPTRSDNSYHVVTGSGTDATAVLDGFTISSGNANSTTASDYGHYGGGALVQSGAPKIYQTSFISNTALFAGGGMADINSSPMLLNVSFSGNVAGDSGGGMFVGGSGHLIMSHTTFISNTAVLGGGSIIANTTTTMSYMTFIGNTANLVGGALINDTSITSLNHAVFSGNTSGTYGSGIANYQSSMTISQVTFSANWSKNNGGALANQKSSPLIRNSVFWGNQGGQIYNYLAGNAPDVQYSLIQGGYITGTHILDADPLFADADGTDNIVGTDDDNLRLQAGSPAINSGNNAFIPADLTDENHNNDINEPAPFDLDGNQRLVDTSVDMGAYERQGIAITSRRNYLPLVGR